MGSMEDLCQILTLYRTFLRTAVSMGQDEDTKATALARIKHTAASIAEKAILVLGPEKGEDIRRYMDALQGDFDAYSRDGMPPGSFAAHMDESRRLLEDRLCMPAIIAASTSGGEKDQAIEILELLISCDLSDRLKALACLILCQKLGKRQPRRAFDLGFEAFELYPSLCADITGEEAHNHTYVYRRVRDVLFDTCPICREGTGTPYYCALPLLLANFTSRFNPVKLWMRCNACGQLFAYNHPEKLIEPQPDGDDLGDAIYLVPRIQFLQALGQIMKRLLSYTDGRRLLDVGAGMGELAAVALEFGCEVQAVEISERQSQRIRDLLNIDVYCGDFLRFDTDLRFDIITMGDVLEHMTDPAAAIEKARMMLAEGGILWISTPNFQSGFSRLMGYGDPMWNEPWHLTYFSYDGLERLLSAKGFTVLDYAISARYNGSMEIIARKD